MVLSTVSNLHAYVRNESKTSKYTNSMNVSTAATIHQQQQQQQ